MSKFIFSLFLFVSAFGLAQKVVDFQELGFNFTIPKGWTGELADDYYVLGHDTIPGLMVLFENNCKDDSTLKKLAMEGIQEEDIWLNPAGEFKSIGTEKVEGFYTGFMEGESVKCYAQGLINGLGNGLNVLIVTSTSKFTDNHVTEAKKLANSINFYQAKETAKTKTWKAALIGKKLAKSSVPVGGSDYSGGYASSSVTNYIKLFNDGHFYYYYNAHSSFDGVGGFGYTNSNQAEGGLFSFSTIGSTTYLILTFESGDIYEYALTKSEKGETFLNGARFYVVGLEE